MDPEVEVRGYHIISEAQIDRGIEGGRKVLEAFSAVGFVSLYGRILSVVEDELAVVPFRPLIETSGPEIFVNTQHQTVIICKESEWWLRQGSKAQPHIDFMIVSASDNSVGLDALKSICSDHFRTKLENGLFADVFHRERLASIITGHSPSGKLLNDEWVRALCRAYYGSLGRSPELTDYPAEDTAEVTSQIPKGLWLESMVADALAGLGVPAQAGVQAGIDELDVVLCTHASVVAIECKDSNLRLNDISVIREKMRRLNIHHALMVITGEHRHPNMEGLIHLWDEDDWNEKVDRRDPFPELSAYVVRSEKGLKAFLGEYLHRLRLDELGAWIMFPDSRPMVPWFSQQNSWGEPIAYWRDWFG